jgi:4-hydroxy-2-oxoheptanedioate aldolase
MLAIRNVAREKLEQGGLSLGIGVRIVKGVEIAKAMKEAGFDWLFLDLEHGTMSLETASQISQAALDTGIAPIARVPKGEFSIATRLLDNGALGIVIPHVDTAEEARAIVEKLRYLPRGHRGLMSSVPQFDFRAVDVAEMMAALNGANLIIVMLESPRAIENASAIAAVPGIDVLLIGTNDLCVELGVHGQLGHPKVVEAYGRVIAACREHAKWPGMGGVYNEPLMAQYVDMGARFILGGGDLGFLLSGAQKRTAFLHGLVKSR